MCKNTGSDELSKMLVQILENNQYQHLLTITTVRVLRTGHCLISPIPDEEAGAEPQLEHLMIRLRGFSQIPGNEINLAMLTSPRPGLSCISIGMIYRYQWCHIVSGPIRICHQTGPSNDRYWRKHINHHFLDMTDHPHI